MARSPFAPPAKLYAGDSWAWEIPDPSAYPSAAHLLTYAIAPTSGGAVVEIEAEAPGIAVRFTLAAAATAALAPGAYRWALTAGDLADPSIRATVAAGIFEVLPDPLAGSDTRSQARRILDAIEATIEGRATKDADQYSIEGRSISRTPIADLLRLRNLYSRIVRREAGRSPITFRKVRFADG